MGITDTIDYTKGPIEDGMEDHGFNIIFDMIEGEKSHSTGQVIPEGGVIIPVGLFVQFIEDKMLSISKKLSWILSLVE